MIDRAVRSVTPIAVACVLVGLLIGTINISGLGIKLSTLVVQLSMGNMFLALLLSAVLTIILGMGMPTVLVYAALYLFIIPALVTMGVYPLAAHLFAFYYGIVSGITPPVCLVAFTGAGIAGSPPMRTGFTAVRMGIASYVLPFLFVFFSNVLIEGSPDIVSAIAAFAACAAVVIFSSAAAEGFMIRNMNLVERLLSLGGIIAVMFPYQGIVLKVIGIALMVLVVIIQGVIRPLRQKRLSMFRKG